MILLIRKINIYTFTEKNIKKKCSEIEFQSSNNVNQHVGNQKNLFQYVFIQSKYRKIGLDHIDTEIITMQIILMQVIQ